LINTDKEGVKNIGKFLPNKSSCSTPPRGAEVPGDLHCRKVSPYFFPIGIFPLLLQDWIEGFNPFFWEELPLT